jgi:DNA modification methylase
MRSNPGETVFTPFMGVGSEVYSAVAMGRKGIGAELKPSYFKQAVRNLETAQKVCDKKTDQLDLLSQLDAA